MEPSRALQNPGANAETFLHADEVDEPPPQPEDFPTSKRHTIPETDASNAPPLDTVEQQDIVADEIHQTSLIDERSSPAEVTQVTSPEGLKPTQYQDGTQLPEDGTRLLPDHWNINPSVGTLTQTGGAPRRPPLKRDSSTPSIAENNAQKAEVLRGVPPRPEQQQDASQDQEAVADSLSLGQLRKLVSEMPKTQQSSYAFDYADSAGFAEELEELFEYTPEERQQLMRTQDTFVRRWISFKQAADTAYQEGKVDWAAETEKTKIDFLKKLEEELLGADASERQSALDCAVYIALGCWIESSKPMGGVQQDSQAKGAYQFAAAQLSMIEQNVNVLFEVIGFETFYKVMQNTYATNEDEEDQGTSPNASAGSSSGLGVKQERWCSFVILYIMADHARRKDNDKMRRHLRALDPPLLGFLMRAMIKARWDDEEFVPPTKLLLLCWKAMLLVFGGTAEVTDIKRALGPESPSSEDDDQPVIQASPLDYHVFRQEIISKYPAFDPPPALFPFESDSTSFVPPLQDHPSRSNSITFAASEAGPANIQPYETPIMQQPVHIATPAPSPPPSPAGPGKAIKKQNYQTNQNFPFLYPPLDSSSNDLGGKGSTELQDLWAGRKWQGRDIPHSILEAADLFSSRMRATRPMKQLWEERVKFLRFERGHEDVDELNLDGCVRGKDKKQKELGADLEMQKLSEEQRARLEAVGDFYADMLPKLQSLVIVLLKVLLQAVTTIITQPLSAESLQKAAGDADDERSLKPLMAMRSQEITGKAVSAIILLMLKWSKLSHILRFEYLSQLLLDNQYIQLILKLFTHQELERVVNHKCEREGLNFFAWCRTQSRHQALSPSDSGEDKPPESGFSDSSVSPDEAVPPPIRRAREPADNTLPESVPPVPQTAPPAPPPEVDELGLPTNAAPAKPITNFNWRVFFTSINHLRILQKLLKAKPHRQLLMVQSKYSLTLKKNLKVPQDLIRLYTLKIIKGQVPYCHRKWRQGNMRIITAIYLHVKPSLREDWLAGLDIEQEVNEALPMEQALRAMTNWWHSKTYPEQMGIPAAASTGPELMSEYMKRLNAVAEEKDAQMVDEILGPAEEDIVDDVVTEANPEAKVPPATETSPSSMRAPDVEATPRPPKFREISPTFDIDYDPFTSSGRGDTTTGGDPTRDGLSDFISSAGRSRSRPSSRPSSRQGSRRPSLKDKLLGDPGPDNDFFLRELEKMDLSGRLSSANSSEADAADINERNAEVERGNARAAMANGAVSVTPLNADGSADQRPSGGEVRYGAMEVKGVNGSLTNVLPTRTTSSRPLMQDEGEAPDDEFLPDWKVIEKGEGLFTQRSSTLGTASSREPAEEEQSMQENASGMRQVGPSTKAAVDAAIASKQRKMQPPSTTAPLPTSHDALEVDRLYKTQRQQEDNMNSLDDEAAVWEDMPTEVVGHPDFWPLLRVFAPDPNRQNLPGQGSASHAVHALEADLWCSYPPPYGIRPNDKHYHHELADYESRLMDAAKSLWASNNPDNGMGSLSSPVLGETSPLSPEFEYDLEPYNVPDANEEPHQGLITWQSSTRRISSPRRPPPPPPPRRPPPVPPRPSRSIRFADEMGGALAHSPDDQQEPAPGHSQTTSALGIHVVEEAEPSNKENHSMAESGFLLPSDSARRGSL